MITMGLLDEREEDDNIVGGDDNDDDDDNDDKSWWWQWWYKALSHLFFWHSWAKSFHPHISQGPRFVPKPMNSPLMIYFYWQISSSN